MGHWAEKYCGAKWSDEEDCLHWFRVISKEQFGVDVPHCHLVDHKRLVASAVRVMRGNILDMFGYRETNDPKEGDGVFMSQGKEAHHLGMVIFLGGKMHVLHALNGAGMVVSDATDLALNGWKINSYWTHAA